MTRGTAHIITNSEVYSTTEFNGDMYPEGKGDEMLVALRGINTKIGLEKLNAAWCEEYEYKSPEDLKLYSIIPTEKDINTAIHYYTVERKDRAGELEDRVAGIRKMMANWKAHILDFNVDYFTYWFSDWVFFKNLSKHDITFITRKIDKIKNQHIVLKPESTIRFCFGVIYPEENPRINKETFDEINKE
jgi:hypothetical protein